MKIFFLLLGARVSSFFAGMKKNPKTGKPRGVGFFVLMALLALYVVGVFFAMFGALFSALGAFLLPTENAWLYHAAALLIATALAFAGSVFATVSQLYEAKDNELLLAMPLSPRIILASRMVFLLLYNLIFTTIVMLPATVAYLGVGIGLGVLRFSGVFFLVLGFLGAPVLALALSCVFGWLLALLLRRVKNRALVQSAFSLLFLGLYFLIYFSALNGLENALEQLDTVLQPLLTALKTVGLPFYLFGMAAEGNWLYGLLSLLIFAVPASLVFFIISRTFWRIALGGGSTRRTVYREKKMRTAPAVISLMRKDVTHLFHSSAYFINAALGLIFLLAAAVAVLFVDPTTLLGGVLDGLPVSDTLGAVYIAIVLFLLSMTFITAPSLSVEAKTLWMLKSYPVSGAQVLGAKVLAQVVLSAPVCLFASVTCIIAARPGFSAALGMLLLPQLFSVLIALFGMIFGTLFPRFVWMNEAEAVKQGLAVLLAMLGGMLLAGIFFALGLLLTLLLNAAVALLALCVLALGLDALLGCIVFYPMAKRFEGLNPPA